MFSILPAILLFLVQGSLGHGQALMAPDLGLRPADAKRIPNHHEVQQMAQCLHELLVQARVNPAPRGWDARLMQLAWLAAIDLAFPGTTPESPSTELEVKSRPPSLDCPVALADGFSRSDRTRDGPIFG